MRNQHPPTFSRTVLPPTRWHVSLWTALFTILTPGFARYWRKHLNDILAKYLWSRCLHGTPLCLRFCLVTPVRTLRVVMPQACSLHDAAKRFNDKLLKVDLYATWSKLRKRHSKVNIYLLFENCPQKCPHDSAWKRRPKPRGHGEFNTVRIFSSFRLFPLTFVLFSFKCDVKSRFQSISQASWLIFLQQYPLT